MQFKPKTDKEIQEMNLWPAGEYNFQVVENVTLGGKVIQTSDAVSKSNNEMIVLVLQVFNENGDSKFIIDYLMESIAKKFKNAHASCGMLDKYEEGSVYASDFVGKKGVVKLKIEKDKSGQYADKNAILDYVVESNTGNPPVGHPAFDDEVPF